MDEWKSALKGDPTDWLLEDDDPTVRYLTLTGILGAGADEPEAVKARRRIMETGLVPRILDAQAAGGWWGTKDAFYTEKYSGTVWQLIILAELAAPDDGRVRKAVEFLLENSQDRESGYRKNDGNWTFHIF